MKRMLLHISGFVLTKFHSESAQSFSHVAACWEKTQPGEGHATGQHSNTVTPGNHHYVITVAAPLINTQGLSQRLLHVLFHSDNSLWVTAQKYTCVSCEHVKSAACYCPGAVLFLHLSSTFCGPST